MDSFFAVLFLLALVALLVGLIMLLFVKGWRRRGGYVALISLVVLCVSFGTFGYITEENAKEQGFLSAADQRMAQQFGYADAAEWGEMRIDIIAKREAVAHQEVLRRANERPSEEALAAADRFIATREERRAEQQQDIEEQHAIEQEPHDPPAIDSDCGQSGIDELTTLPSIGDLDRWCEAKKNKWAIITASEADAVDEQTSTIASEFLASLYVSFLSVENHLPYFANPEYTGASCSGVNLQDKWFIGCRLAGNDARSELHTYVIGQSATDRSLLIAPIGEESYDTWREINVLLSNAAIEHLNPAFYLGDLALDEITDEIEKVQTANAEPKDAATPQPSSSSLSKNQRLAQNITDTTKAIYGEDPEAFIPGQPLCRDARNCDFKVNGFRVMVWGRGIADVETTSFKPHTDYRDVCVAIFSAVAEADLAFAREVVLGGFLLASQSGEFVTTTAETRIEIRPSLDNILGCSFFKY